MEQGTGPVESINAITLVTRDMASAAAFYEAIGFARLHGGPDAPWGERYFHVRDPDGHELSFARLLD